MFSFLIVNVNTYTLQDFTQLMNKERLNEARLALESIEHDMPDTYYKLLMQCGEYKAILNEKGDNKYKQRAKELNAMDVNKNLDTLYKESPHSALYNQLMFERMLENGDYSGAKKIMSFARKCIDEALGDKMEVHMNIVQNGNDRDYEGLKDVNIEAYNSYKNLKERFDSMRNDYGRLLGLYKDFHVLIKKDTFKPSIFVSMKRRVLERIITLGTIEKRRGLNGYLRDLLDIRSDDNSMRLYFLYKISIEDMAVEKEIKDYKFGTKAIENAVLNEFRLMKSAVKEKEERMRKQKEQEQQRQKQQQEYQRQQQRQYQQQGSRGSGKGQSNDPKGYYKILGVKPDATKKEIKSSWSKLVKTMIPDKEKTEKAKKKMSEDLAKVHEAKSVLYDDKKRQMYDSGMSTDGSRQGRQGQQHMYNQDIPDIFKMFMNSDDIFGGFTGRGGGSRTYTFRTSYL